jgi:hypothetical protein
MLTCTSPRSAVYMNVVEVWRMPLGGKSPHNTRVLGHQLVLSVVPPPRGFGASTRNIDCPRTSINDTSCH